MIESLDALENLGVNMNTLMSISVHVLLLTGGTGAENRGSHL